MRSKAFVKLMVVSLMLIGASGMSLSSSSSATQRANTAGSGRIVGLFEAEGGPPPGNPRPISGIISIQGKLPAEKVNVDVSLSGRFSVEVRDGTYEVLGRSPQFDDSKIWCSANKPITVKNLKTTHVTVTCDVP